MNRWFSNHLSAAGLDGHAYDAYTSLTPELLLSLGLLERLKSRKRSNRWFGSDIARNAVCMCDRCG